MKRLFILAACVAAMAFGGCVSERGVAENDKPAVQAPAGPQATPTDNRSFGDEQYIWESW